jgi:hypothetical protein
MIFLGICNTQLPLKSQEVNPDSKKSHLVITVE